MTLKAYQKTQAAVESPRNTEYRLFGQVTGALLEAQKASAKGAPLIDAIDGELAIGRSMAAISP